MQRTLTQLLAQADQLGLKLPDKAKRGKDELVTALREHLWKAGDLRFLGKQNAYPATSLTDAGLDHLFADPGWVAEKKENGVRLRCHVHDGRLRFSTTVLSVETYNYTEVHCLPHIRINAPSGTLIEGELVSTIAALDTGNTVAGSPLHVVTALLSMRPDDAIRLQERCGFLKFVAFDLLTLDSQNLCAKRQAFRTAKLSELKRNDHFAVSGFAVRNKREFYENVIRDGGEGVVLKNLDAPYAAGERPRDSWVKVKASIEMDAFVTGTFSSKKQVVAGLEFSAFVNGEQIPVARIASLHDDMRQKIERGEMSPLGMVAEITGQEWSAKARRLTHARISRWRLGPDAKTPAECVLGETGGDE